MESKPKIILTFAVFSLFFLFPLFGQKNVTTGIPPGFKSYEELVLQLDQQIAREPNAGLSYLNRAYAEMMLGRYDKALRDYKIAYEKTLSFDALLGIQWAYYALKNFDETIEIGNEILDRQPNNYYSLLRMAESFYEKQEYVKAYKKYSDLIESHGEEGYTVWKKGMSAYYSGNYIKADQLFKRAYELAPSNPNIEYSFKNSKVYPYFVVTPEYASSSFKGSDFLGKGQRVGLNLNMGINEDWSFRFGVSKDQTQNLNSTKGVENYLIDPLSLAYTQSALTLFSSTYPTLQSYLLATPNVYNIFNLAQSESYITNRYSSGVTYKVSENFYLFGSGNYLAANSSYLNGGHTGQLGISYSNQYTVSFSASSINHPSSKGGQGTLSLTVPFLDFFYSSSTLAGQSMIVNDTAAKAESQFYVYYLGLNTALNYAEAPTIRRNYGFYQQEIGFSSTYFFTAIGGRIGKSRNPLFGESWVYPGFDMQNGGYGRIGMKWAAFTLQFDYSRDYWLDSRNDRPVSDTFKISLTGTF